MNSRQRIQSALRFEPPDRLPCDEWFWDGVLDEWRREGMPDKVEAADYFDFDLCWMGLDTSPRFEQKIISREEGMITYRDRFGYTVRKRDGIASSMEFFDHATTDRAAWEQIKPRFSLATDPDAESRLDTAGYFGHFDSYPTWNEVCGKYARLRETNRYLLFHFYGPWEASWRHRGMENLLVDMAADRDWLTDMAETQVSLALAALEHCVKLGLQPDGIFIAEDLGSTRSMLFSPASWRAALKPSYARLGEFLRGNGIDFWMHSCGAIQPIIDDLVECGLQVLNPLQVSAGLDVVDLRRRYGTRLAFYGNVEVKKMFGPQEPLLEELRRKIPLARQGGYVFRSDHSLPPQVGFERFCWILKTARAIFEDSR